MLISLLECGFSKPVFRFSKKRSVSKCNFLFNLLNWGAPLPAKTSAMLAGGTSKVAKTLRAKRFLSRLKPKKTIDVLVASRGQCLAATDSHFGYCLGMRLGEERLKRWFSPPSFHPCSVVLRTQAANSRHESRHRTWGQLRERLTARGRSSVPMQPVASHVSTYT